MAIVDRDVINNMREAIQAIQAAVTSLSARLDELSFEADVENDPVISIDVAGADLVALRSRLVERRSTGADYEYLDKFNGDFKMTELVLTHLNVMNSVVYLRYIIKKDTVYVF